VQTDEARKTIDAIFADAEFDPKRNQYFVIEELKRYNVIARLVEIAVPSLIIGGTHDVHVSPSWSQLMAEKIPGAELVMMERSGHFPWFDEPEEFFAAVKRFLQ
jgi:proline iminopeptidase